MAHQWVCPVARRGLAMASGALGAPLLRVLLQLSISVDAARYAAPLPALIDRRRVRRARAQPLLCCCAGGSALHDPTRCPFCACRPASFGKVEDCKTLIFTAPTPGSSPSRAHLQRIFVFAAFDAAARRAHAARLLSPSSCAASRVGWRGPSAPRGAQPASGARAAAGAGRP
jgi:hypothetical protein